MSRLSYWTGNNFCQELAHGFIVRFISTYTFNSLSEQFTQQFVRFRTGLSPRFRYRFCNTAFLFSSSLHAFGYSNRLAIQQVGSCEELPKAFYRCRWILLEDVYCIEPSLFPTPLRKWKIEPPDRSIGQHRDLYSRVKGILEKLCLVCIEIFAHPLGFDECELLIADFKAIINPALTGGILRYYLVYIVSIPFKPR